MRKLLFILALLFVFTACSPNDQKIIEKENQNFLESLQAEDREIVQAIVAHEDVGLYVYETSQKEDGKILRLSYRGYGDGVRINAFDATWELFGEDQNTIIDTERKIFHTIKHKKSTEQLGPEGDSTSRLHEMVLFGLQDVEQGSQITLRFADGGYQKYDPKTLDLLEESFVAGGIWVIRRLKEKTDVQSVKDKYEELMQSTQEMQEVDSMNAR